MSELPNFLEHPGGTHGAIMSATYAALIEHGYSDLTIQRIGDEFSKSKSLLYHHYDSKDDLLLDFLEFMLDQTEDSITGHRGTDFDEHLTEITRLSFGFGDETLSTEFVQAIAGLRSQAAHDEAYREHFTRSDRFIRKNLAHTIRAGIDDGVFRDVDPEETAALFHSVFLGTMLLRVTNDDEDALEASRAAFEGYVQDYLVEAE